jgi:hypothetical protein
MTRTIILLYFPVSLSFIPPFPLIPLTFFFTRVPLHPFSSPAPGFTPRLPDTLQVDTTAPALTRWFLRRDSTVTRTVTTTTTTTSFTLYLDFTEPVLLELVDLSGLRVYYTSRDAKTLRPVVFGTAPFALAAPQSSTSSGSGSGSSSTNITPSSPAAAAPVPMTASNSNRRIVAKLINFCPPDYAVSTSCLSSNDPRANLFTFLNQTIGAKGYFLAISAASVRDWAPVANPIAQVVERKAVAETGPGKAADTRFIS